MSACILAIGNEITSGEVVNSNAAALAARIETIGFEVTWHMAVPDDLKLVQDALKLASERCDLIMISGGLGPTSDDLTREAVAQWAGKELEFNDAVWAEMQAIYQRRGLPIREAHRHQCHFPKGSTILKNSVGTAHGFLLKEPLPVFVLPGPPRELFGMWSEIEPYLANYKPLTARTLYTWTLLGLPESEAAEITEKTMKGSGLQLGYRASVPYVKVKVWVPDDANDSDKWIDRLSEALKPWHVGNATYDSANLFVERLRACNEVTVIEDFVTDGRLAGRLSEIPVSFQFKILTASNAYGSAAFPSTSKGAGAESSTLHLRLTPKSESSVNVGWSRGVENKEAELELPYKIDVQSKRGKTYITELAMHWWTQNLK